jgi:CHASE3 domain sensor protein
LKTKRQAFIRNTIVALAGSAVLLIGIISSTLYLVYETQGYSEQLVTSRRVRSTAADLLLMLRQAESGQRGYLLMLDDDFLASYRDAASELRARLAAFEKAVQGSAFIMK